ncbi:MAG: hypothetical protein OK438_01435 [Thaumarchaeota archaeon]|nr:hypothetical protein [Nitrososphaerota archaeon]
MIDVDCSELTTDEQLALASEISDALEGRWVALVRDQKIVLGQVTGGELDKGVVQSVVEDFVSRRKGHEWYSLERKGDTLFVHGADPIPAMEKRPKPGLPPNVLQCPFCPFVTPYQEALVVHTRAHGFVA